MVMRRTTQPLIALAGATLTASLAVSIATVTLPALSREFAAPIASIQWVILAYLVSTTVTIVLAGHLGDQFGNRRVLIIGTAIFALASAVCVGAPTLGVLVAGRAIQGLGGAVLLSLPLSVIRQVASKERTGSALGLLATMSAIGTALGPSVGGILISQFGWRAAFGGLTVLSVLVLGLSIQFIPEMPAGRRDRGMRADWLGAGLLAVTLILYALATTGGHSVPSWIAVLLLPSTALAFVAFMIAELRADAPLVPFSILRNRPTAMALSANLLVSTSMMSTLVVGPYFLSFALGLNDVSVGLVMAIGPMTAALTGVLAGRATDRFGAQPVVTVGLIEIVLGLVCLALLPRYLGVVGYIAALVVLTPGFQLFIAANSTTVLLTAPANQRGLLSGLIGLSRNLGFMTGASVMTALFAATVGSDEITRSSAGAVSEAFTTTFLAAAAATLLAATLALVGQAAAVKSEDGA
ncbi:MFS transporter [Sinorhizobium sp. BG8]|uniref:MFS transporter n=1 Tax=Sinorhizobium sp. BG8 TaxID=2613773 RepID=UPI00193D1E13|nr:MFS transporter [Sinorhizobium sp. BG8]